MTFKEKYLLDHPEAADRVDAVIRSSCPIKYGYDIGHVCGDYCFTTTCFACWDREMPEEYDEGGKEVITALGNMSEAAKNASDAVGNIPRILDSGNRREFESGAVRDCPEGKGRCDLLPLDVVEEVTGLSVFGYIAAFMEDGETRHLVRILENSHRDGLFTDMPTMLLEVAIHFEEGAKKYGDSNWQKGIPVRCYIDSAVRHYLKFLRGDKDEPHDRAFAWNLLCAIWTCKHKPELNDYAKGEKE